MSEDISDYHNWGKGDATGIQWLEARDTAKHPTNAQDSPTTKNYLRRNVNRAAVEKPWSR